MEKQSNEVNIVLTQWQTCVQMADSISKRRDTTNHIFVTLNLALLAALKLESQMQSFVLLGFGIVLCILWRSIIMNFKRLNAAKYKIINDMEENLPEKPFTNEWKELQVQSKYKEGTSLERRLPLIFCLVYAFIFLMLFLDGGIL